MKTSFITSLLVPAAAAFPAVFDPAALEEAGRHLAERQAGPGTQDPLGISKAQTNCGPTPCLTFNEDQEVSVTGEHAYASPGVSDIRGPCPGLNAAANHGYLPRNGIVSLEETVAGLEASYSMSPELGAVLAAYAIATNGNLLQGVWSIGGPLPTDPLTGGLVGTGQGLSYSHNNYEGDASIGRNDAYTNNGDAHSLSVEKFEKVYMLRGKEDRYTLDKFRSRFESVQDESIANNPYFFTGLFSTVVVVPAAYNFVINFMSNHTKEEPSGYLDGYNFKTFFGVSGEPGNMKWHRGQERIPENWYKRPTTNPYTASNVGEDVAIGYAAYPRTLKVGGNTGKPNSFVGVDVADLSGGVFNAKNLLQGNNFSCFAFSLAQNGPIGIFSGGALQKATSFLNKHISPITQSLNCPKLGKTQNGLFNQFPGYKYKPNGPATNYKA